jgi:hypothetical protein
MPLNENDFLKDFAYVHERLEFNLAFLRKFELVPKDTSDPDIFDLLDLPRTPDPDPETVRAAHLQASKKKMRGEKMNGEVAREVGKAIDRARDILLSPVASAAYRQWRHAAAAAAPPAPAPIATPDVTRASRARRLPLAAGVGAAAAAGMTIIAFLALRAGGTADGRSAAETAAPVSTVSPAAQPMASVPPVNVVSRRDTSGADAAAASRRESEAAKDINNAIAAEVGVALVKQQTGKLTAAEAAAVRKRLRERAEDALRHAQAAQRLDPDNDSAAYEAVAALYYQDDMAGAYRRAREAASRFPSNSDIKAIKTLIEARLR